MSAIRVPVVPVHVAADCAECRVFLRLIPAARTSRRGVRELVSEAWSAHLARFRAIAGVES